METSQKRFRNVRATIILLALCALIIAQEPSPQKQNNPPVKLSMIVIDQANHSIDALKKEDVQVVDDGVPQILLTITKDERPVDYALVIDNSGSFRDVLEPAIEAAEIIIASNRAEDETFIERFISSEKIE